MAPPSKLAVATSSLERLVKEEASYHKELEQQQARIKKVEANPNDENAEYRLKQERQAMKETEDVLVTMKDKIEQAIKRLDDALESNKDAGGEVPVEEINKAKAAIVAGRKSLREVS